MTRNVGIFLFTDVEVLDFAGPFEVFSTAARVKSRAEPANPTPFQVLTVAERLQTIKVRGGLNVFPAYDFTNHPHIEVLIIPGGVVTAELARENVLQWIFQTALDAEITASVCTGAFLLAKAGLLDGKTATTHWEDIPDLQTMFPHISVEKEKRWIDEGRIITSAGISAGIDMSLHLVARLEDEILACKTARQMEFEWTRSSY